jgi:hypothetical protein
LRTTARPRRYVARHWFYLMRPALRYSVTRDAFVLHLLGNSRGPVLRPDRRSRHQAPFEGAERRGNMQTA